MEYSITLHNKVIYEFYQEHQNVDIEEMNLLFIEILGKLFKDSNTTLQNGVAKQLLDNVKSLQSQVNSFQDTFSKIEKDLNTSFVMKFQDFKKDYIEDLKMILNNNTSEKVAPLIERYNDILQDKTKILINEMGIKNQDILTKEILGNMKKLQDTINQDTQELLKQQINKETLNLFVTSIDEKFSKSLVNSQSVLNTLVSSSEQRIQSKITDINDKSDKKLDEIRDLATKNTSIHSQLHTNLGEMLKKMENSSLKGRISENLLYNLLQTIYPIAQLDYVGGSKESGDIILVRRDKPVILFENKNYDVNVGKAEIEKFYRDIDQQGCNGILLSQKTGIVNKNNYEIEIYNGKIVLFLHNVSYDSDKIKVAVDIIDYFQEKYKELHQENDDLEIIDVNKQLLNEINKEFQDFVVDKLNHIKTIKEYNQKILNQAENFKFPSLENLLNKHFSNSLSSKDFTCSHCNYIGKNLRGLAAHLRACEKEKDIKPPPSTNVSTSVIQKPTQKPTLSLTTPLYSTPLQKTQMKENPQPNKTPSTK